MRERTRQRILRAVRKHALRYTEDGKPVVLIEGEELVVDDIRVIGTLGKWARA